MTAAIDKIGRQRDRLVVLATLVALIVIAWIYLWIDARNMDSMSMGASVINDAAVPDAMAARWIGVTAFGLTFLMWSIMMVGMMLPSAAPAILLYAAMVRKGRERGSSLSSAWIFTSGYLAVWTSFSLVMAILQTVLAARNLLTPSTMMSASPWLSGILLISAGLYQWLPLKEACLQKCRSPLQQFLFGWRPGGFGAFRMGAEHGFFCLGCCWVLMLVLFAAGVMNLLWVVLIAGFIFIEKLAPAGLLIGRAVGVGMIVAGVGFIFVGG